MGEAFNRIPGARHMVRLLSGPTGISEPIATLTVASSRTGDTFQSSEMHLTVGVLSRTGEDNSK